MAERRVSPVRGWTPEQESLPTRPVALYRDQTVARRVRLGLGDPLPTRPGPARPTEPPTVLRTPKAAEPPTQRARLAEPVTRCYPTATFAQLHDPCAPRAGETTAQRASNAVTARKHGLVLAAVCCASMLAAIAWVQVAPRRAAQATLPSPESTAKATATARADSPPHSSDDQPPAGVTNPPGEPSAAFTPPLPAHDAEPPPPSEEAPEPPRTAAGELRRSRSARAHSPRAAAELLAGGRYDAALAAYRELAAGSPDGNVYAYLASVIERRLARRCAQGRSLGEEPCVRAEP